MLMDALRTGIMFVECSAHSQQVKSAGRSASWGRGSAAGEGKKVQVTKSQKQKQPPSQLSASIPFFDEETLVGSLPTRHQVTPLAN